MDNSNVYMHPSMRHFISYDSITNTGILYASAWIPSAVFKVVRGKDVFKRSLEACQGLFWRTHMVTLKNVIDYTKANFDKTEFSDDERDGTYQFHSQPFVLRVAALTVDEFETFCKQSNIIFWRYSI